MTAVKGLVALVAVATVAGSTDAGGTTSPAPAAAASLARTTASPRLVAPPITVYHYISPATHLTGGAYFYRVIVRLARPLPSSGRRVLAAITLDGGGAYEGVVHAVPTA